MEYQLLCRPVPDEVNGWGWTMGTPSVDRPPGETTAELLWPIPCWTAASQHHRQRGGVRVNAVVFPGEGGRHWGFKPKNITEEFVWGVGSRPSIHPSSDVMMPITPTTMISQVGI